MNHSELVAAVADDSQLDARTVQAVLDSLAHTVQQQVSAGGRVQINGLTVIETAERKERPGRNPRTGEAITIPARRAVRFTPAAAVKRAALR